MQGLERSRGANRLTALEVRKASGPAVLEDGAGLRLFINDAGQKHWIVRVTINGKRVARGLGSFPAVSLQAARDRADVIRNAASNGQDAATEIKQEQVRQAMTAHRLDQLTREWRPSSRDRPLRAPATTLCSSSDQPDRPSSNPGGVRIPRRCILLTAMPLP